MVNFCNKLQSGCLKGWMLSLVMAMALAIPSAASAQKQTVTGTVVDQNGLPVIGVTILEKGTTNGATTGIEGTYSLVLKGSQPPPSLIFSHLATFRRP